MDEIVLAPEQEAEAEQIEDIVRAGAAAEIRAIARLLASKDNRHLLGPTEFLVRDAVLRIGSRAVDAVLSARKKKGYQGSSISCPNCHEAARFVDYRGTGITCLMGKAIYERAYYHCKHCQQGWFPTDEELNIEGKQTPGAREVLSLVGLLDPFDEAAEEVLPRLTGLNVSASTVQRTTEGVGADVAQRREAGETFGPEENWDWHLDATGQRVAYVSLDATGVPQQGPRAEKAEGRMAWVGAVFNPQPTEEKKRSRRVWDIRYLSGLLSLPEVGRQLRQECRAVGISRADVVIGLTDGGNGLENCLLEVLGGLARQIEFVLDFYHAAEHVLEFAQVLLPHDEAARQQQVEAWCHRLKHQGGEALRDELNALDLSRASPAVIEAHRQLLGYIQNNLHRMDYPRYIARGWQIGSGIIESACKTVVGQRLKAAGMRWREQGTTALCQLRALFKSGSTLWNAYWRPATVT